MAGTLTYGGVLADYRRYFMPVRPFTFAVRGLHYGRYGADAEDSRLTPLFLGYQGLVRGYDFGSFDANECDSIDMSTCEAFDRLNGSRVAVASAELRFPLLGLFSRKSFYGPFPIEMALFADAGLAWTSATKPRSPAAIATGSAAPASRCASTCSASPSPRSTTSARSIARASGWLWQFGLTPGF